MQKYLQWPQWKKTAEWPTVRIYLERRRDKTPAHTINVQSLISDHISRRVTSGWHYTSLAFVDHDVQLYSPYIRQQVRKAKAQKTTQQFYYVKCETTKKTDVFVAWRRAAMTSDRSKAELWLDSINLSSLVKVTERQCDVVELPCSTGAYIYTPTLPCIAPRRDSTACTTSSQVMQNVLLICKRTTEVCYACITTFLWPPCVADADILFYPYGQY